jgi:hypothetical protein
MVKKKTKTIRKLKHLSIRGLAIRKNPGWLSRGRGQLRQQPLLSRKQRRRIVHQGDEALLKAYIDKNRAVLSEELKVVRDVAEAERVTETGLPATKQEWVSFLDEDQDRWRRALDTAHVERRKLSRRLQARPGLGEARRVYPAPAASHGWAPHWAHLEAGCYCFQTAAGDHYWCYVASIGRTVYAMPLSLYDHGKRILSLRLVEIFHETFRPISAALGVVGVPDNLTTQAHLLELSVVEFREDCVLLQVLGSERVTPAAPRRADGVLEETLEAEEEEEVADAAFLRKLAGLGPDADSDGDSIVSSDESTCSDRELDEGDGSEECEEGGAAGVERKAAGTHVVAELSNEYFTFVDNRGYENVRVLLRPRWVEFLADGIKSKTLTPHLVGDFRARPVRAFLVLRAWAVGRFQHRGFHLTKSARKKFFERECAALKAAIRAHPPVGEPSVGNAEADGMIREYALGLL